MVKTKLAPSKSEAKRLILQREVKIDGKILEDWRKVIPIKKRVSSSSGEEKIYQDKLNPTKFWWG